MRHNFNQKQKADQPFRGFLSILIILCAAVFATASSAQTSNDELKGSDVATAAQIASEQLENAQPSANNIPLKAIPGMPALTVKTNPDGSEDYTVSLQILAIMTGLTLLPALLMMMTSFTRIIIVFAILRQALGLQQSPSNQILIGLSLFLTMFIMTPVFEVINADALQPYIEEKITARQALEAAREPVHQFMLAQTRESDIDLFMRIAQEPSVDTPSDLPLNILIPAFVTSELKTAFQIGFIIFIPFLVIDIVVASVLMAMGMMMLSPLIISLPFKIMLFVLVDGWAMLIGTLAASYGY